MSGPTKLINRSYFGISKGRQTQWSYWGVPLTVFVGAVRATRAEILVLSYVGRGWYSNNIITGCNVLVYINHHKFSTYCICTKYIPTTWLMNLALCTPVLAPKRVPPPFPLTLIWPSYGHACFMTPVIYFRYRPPNYFSRHPIQIQTYWYNCLGTEPACLSLSWISISASVPALIILPNTLRIASFSLRIRFTETPLYSQFTSGRDIFVSLSPANLYNMTNYQQSQLELWKETSLQTLNSRIRNL